MTNGHAAANQPARPPWLSEELYPFESHYADIGEARVHYVDEGTGPPLLLLHGNPTWSFLYRDLVKGLRDRFRCIAPDYPGFGLSRAAPGYGYTPAEHANVLEQLLLKLDLEAVTMMVQDWGGPIGFAAATRHPDRFAAFVIGNTWAWPKSDLGTQLFSRLMGGPVGGFLILRRNFFVEKIIPGSVKRKKLPEAVMDAYRGPFPTPESRRPLYVFPREILASRPFLAEIERGLPALADRPALLVWPTKDVAFREPERRRWEQLFPNHSTVMLDGAGHYIQETPASRSSPRSATGKRRSATDKSGRGNAPPQAAPRDKAPIPEAIAARGYPRRLGSTCFPPRSGSAGLFRVAAGTRPERLRRRVQGRFCNA